MHPVIAEILRSSYDNIKPDVWRRWQAVLRDEIAPALAKQAEPVKRQKESHHVSH